MALCIRQVIDEDPPRIVVISNQTLSKMKVGDNVQVTISGQTLSGPGGGMISIGQGGSMSVPGIIIQDLGDRWLVRLSISIGGADTVQVAK